MSTQRGRRFEKPMPFLEVAPAKFTDVIATNLTGYFLVAREFATRFVTQG